MANKEATARIKINKLLEKAGRKTPCLIFAEPKVRRRAKSS
jgi:hypothetical protein